MLKNAFLAFFEALSEGATFARAPVDRAAGSR
jgi:hypothetical protein